MEGFRIGVVDRQILLDGLLELPRRAMRASMQVPLGQRGKSALHLIEPGR